VHVGGSDADQHVIATVLQDAGIASVRVLVPAEAVAAVGAQQVDVLIVDTMQESQDVVALLQAAAAVRNEGRVVPVIVTAPLGATSRIAACLKRGADDYVITPLDPDQPVLVTRRLEHCLARNRVTASAAPAMGSEPTERIPILSAPVAAPPNGKSAPSDDQAYIHRFIPREFLDKLQRESLAEVKLGDHAEHEMTVFFSDIRDFTFLSESLTPTQNFNFLTSYLRNVTPIIRKNGGFVDKYLGDGVMALFDGDAIDAVRSSVELQKKLEEYNRGRRLAGYVSIKVGMGMHRGRLMLGTIGTEDQMQTTVIADAVNLAARIEGMTKTFGVSMLLSSTVVAGLPRDHTFMLRCLGAVAAKGKTQSIDIYECYDNDEAQLREHKQRTSTQFAAGMEEFRKGKLLTAGKIFARIAEFCAEDTVAAYFRDRCSLSVIHERDRGKGAWDGVEHLEVK
jgi:class 3 adenylate cyclase